MGTVGEIFAFLCVLCLCVCVFFFIIIIAHYAVLMQKYKVNSRCLGSDPEPVMSFAFGAVLAVNQTHLMF